jgi:hypothetical protein
MRKKPFQSKWSANPLAFLTAMQGVEPLVDGQQRDIALSYWATFDAITKGFGQEDHFHVLAGTINIACALTEMKHCEQFQATFISAQDALLHCWRRYSEHGKLGFSGTEIQVMRTALHRHDVQLQYVPQKHMMQAVNEAMERKKQGHVLEMVPA